MFVAAKISHKTCHYLVAGLSNMVTTMQTPFKTNVNPSTDQMTVILYMCGCMFGLMCV